MKNYETHKIVFLVLIAGRKQKDDLLTTLLEQGAHLTSTLYGRGTVNASLLMNALGLVPEENKAMIACLVKSETCDKILKILIEKFNFDKPNTGVAFTIPIDKLSF